MSLRLIQTLPLDVRKQRRARRRNSLERLEPRQMLTTTFESASAADEHMTVKGPMSAEPQPSDTREPHFSNSQSSTDWTNHSKLNHPRAEPANAVVDGKIYVFGGIHDPFRGPAQVEVYDPAVDRWSVVSKMPNSRHHVTAGSAVRGSQIWIVGGKTSDDQSGERRVDVFDAATNQWRRGPDLPETHWGGPSIILNNKLHVLTGGTSAHATTDHHFVLDLDDESAGWSTAAPVPAPRVHAGGVALDGKLYVLGGEFHHSHDGDTNTVQVYDPETDQWSLSPANLPRARSHLEWSTFTYEGTIITVSGVDSSSNPRGQSEVYQYHPDANEWRLIANLPHKAVSPGAKVVNDRLYVFAGSVNDWFFGPMNGTMGLPFAQSETRIVDLADMVDRSTVIVDELIAPAGNSSDALLDDAPPMPIERLEDVPVEPNDVMVIESPMVFNQHFDVLEDAVERAPIGSIRVADPGDARDLVFKKAGGSGEKVFDLERRTGKIKVSAGATLDYETKKGYSLDVEVADRTNRQVMTSATMYIRIGDVPESVKPPNRDTDELELPESPSEVPIAVFEPTLSTTTTENAGAIVSPRVNTQFFSAPAGAPERRTVGTVAADPGDARRLSFQLSDPTGANLFEIDPHTGKIKVAVPHLPMEPGIHTFYVTVHNQDQVDLVDHATIRIEIKGAFAD